MSFGDILVAKGLASPEQIVRALDHQKAKGGRIVIDYYSAEELDRILEKIG